MTSDRLAIAKVTGESGRTKLNKDLPDWYRNLYDSPGLGPGLLLYSERKERGKTFMKKGYVRSRGVKIKCHFLTGVSENGGAGEV